MDIGVIAFIINVILVLPFIGLCVYCLILAYWLYHNADDKQKDESTKSKTRE